MPPNLLIIGTMNTADRSIALLDVALRRRFTFEELMPEESLVPEDVEGVPLCKTFSELNRRITRLVDQDHQIGHSYFMKATSLEKLHFEWRYRVLPLLKEYFYGDDQKLRHIFSSHFDPDDDPKGDLYEALMAKNQQPSEGFTNALKKLAAG